ncbi:uncharacterized protein TNCV_182711 [Trichonephila clavipes]|nr:uncharacterized protein TNCV_182711 [Trichonephila clavipes]
MKFSLLRVRFLNEGTKKKSLGLDLVTEKNGQAVQTVIHGISPWKTLRWESECFLEPNGIRKNNTKIPSTLQECRRYPHDRAGCAKFVKQFTCRNCGGGDRGRVAIYRPFGEVSLSLNRTVTCMVLKGNDRRTSCPCHDEFRGPRSDYVRQVALATTQQQQLRPVLKYFMCNLT